MKINVEILNTAIVYPSPPSFQPLPLPLSHLDTDRILHIPFRTLRLYAHDAVDSFTSVLLAALALYFPLTLPLCPHHSDSRLQIDDAPLASMSLSRAASPLTLFDLCTARPGAPMLDQFAPDPTADEALARPLSIQLMVLTCGGLAVNMCVRHALCDGASATQFLSTVAVLARGAPTSLPSLLFLAADLLIAFMWVTYHALRWCLVRHREFPNRLLHAVVPDDLPTIDVFICTPTH